MNIIKILSFLSPALAYLSFTVMDTIIKIVSSNPDNSLIVILFVLNLAAFVYYCILFHFLKWEPLKTKKYKFHLIRGTINIFAASSILYSFAYMSLVQVYVIIFAAPFLSTLLGIFFLKDKVSIGGLVSIVLGLAGILIAMRPWNQEFTANHLITFFGASMITASFLMLKSYGKDEKPLTIAFYSSGMLVIFYGILSIFFYAPLPLPNVLMLVGAGLLMSFSALLVTYGILKFGFATMGVFQYTQLIWGGIISYFMFDEIPTVYFYFGASFIILGGLINSANRILRTKWL